MKIAIVGKMCSGKSTIAKQIQLLDNRYQIFSFGQKVKDIAIDLFNMKKKDRNLLINIGMKLREINPDVWVDYIIKKTKNEKFCIIDDVRFQNEYDALILNGFIIIQLDIFKDDQIKRIKKCYPENYQDHIQNIDNISEKLNINYKINPILKFNTIYDEYCKINHELNLLLFKK